MAKNHRTDVELGNELTRFVAETKYADIPEDIIALTKSLTLKTVASTVAGVPTPWAQQMAEVVRRRGLPEDAGVIGFGFKTSLWEAALVNSFTAHASELEDNRFYGGCSWDITVIPVLLTAAQQLKLSGKDLMGAMALGLEAHCRTTQFGETHRGIAILAGAAGPALAFARALRLDAKTAASALGLSCASVPIVLSARGTSAHFMESAMHALHGVMAAEMAREGMVAQPEVTHVLATILGEGKVSAGKLVEGLGTNWLMRDFWFKKYPCCWGIHREVDAFLDLKRQYKLSHQDIERIEVNISPDHFALDREPKTEGDLQFSLQHCLAAASLHGDTTLKDVTAPALTDPSFVEARSKVKVFRHEEYSPVIMAEPAYVVVKTKDGREFSKKRTTVLGSREEPLTTDQFRELYGKFCAGILPDKDIVRTADLILNLENLPDVTELMETLTFGCLKKTRK